MALIEIENVTKSFGSTTAVNNVSLNFDRGQLVGLLGPNGAGKTTTLRLLCGYYTPDQGSIIIDGHSLREERRLAQKHIAYMPESNPLYDNMLVSEFFDFMADVRHVATDKRLERYHFAVTAMEIADVFYRPIGELSKGYRQRVGIGATLLSEPDVLVLDEPTEGLDPNQRSSIRALIKDLAKNRTVIMSTHVLSEAEALADRLIIINQGAVIADDSVSNIKNKMHGMKQYRVGIAGSDCAALLQNISRVDKVKTEQVTDNYTLYTVETASDTRFPDALHTTLEQHERVLWHLSEEADSLDTIFTRLTTANDTYVAEK